MATLDDIRAAGFDVTLSWEGWHEQGARTPSPDVYAISRPGAQPDPSLPGYDTGMLSYLPDDPVALDLFLASVGGV